MVPASMKVATRTSAPPGARAMPSRPLTGTPWAVSGAAATASVEAIGLGEEATGPWLVTLIVVVPTTVEPVLPRSVRVTLTG